MQDFQMIDAFLLTRDWRDTPGGICLYFWLATEAGPRQLRIENQSAVCFVRASEVEQARQVLANVAGAEIKALELQTFDGDSVYGVYCRSQQALYRCRDQLTQHGVACYESDIRPTDRYLTERFITAPVTVESDQPAEALVNARMRPGDYKPRLTVMSLDIESDYESWQLFSIAFICGDVKRVLMIGEGNDDSCEYVADEAALISSWLDYVARLDPDVLTGWNVVNFDLHLLQQRAQRHRLAFTLGREGALPRWRQPQGEGNQRFVFVPGRVVLDGVDTLKAATYNFESFSLEYVSNQLLGRGKLIDSRDQADPFYKAREIRRQFNEDKPALARYNLEDCQLVLDIFAATDLLDFAIERAALTGLEMDRSGGSVAAFDNLYLPRLHRKGYIAPNIGDYQGELSAPGGYVMDSLPGLYESVLVLDYKSLYPSIIRTFRIDPYGRIAAQQADVADTIPGYDGAVLHKTEHILPGIIEHLWQARDQAKRDGNAALSQAIKIIMNSFYGVLGTSGCRLHDSSLTSSITRRGHDIIRQTVSLIEAEGYAVIYGDTDSVFVSLGGAFGEQAAAEIGDRLASAVNDYWQQVLAADYGISSCLEMEFETHFRQFFMPTVRGSEQGSKKRYAGLVEQADGERKLVFKGLETVRTDWTELARQFQQELYRLVFDGEAYDGYITETVERLQAGEFDHWLVYRKRLHKKLREYQKNIPPHAQAALKAEAEFKQQGKTSRYQGRGWVSYVITQSGPETVDSRHSPIDYEHYIEKQLKPIADTILTVVGSSFEQITDRQQSLF